MNLARRVLRRARWELQGRPGAHPGLVPLLPDNTPDPLRNPPIALLGDALSQMSFGERSALEGLLSQLKPSMSIEIGTAGGGSLQSLAAHSAQVHAFDLDDGLLSMNLPRNVTFHSGDSATLVPTVLDDFAARGIAVDFALIDGDHAADGVRADLENLLASPACDRTMILLHDTMYPDTRAGIERVGLADHPKVVYAELDFIPGYEFSTGSFAGQRWGGFGLVITGDRRTDGYGDQPVQTRYRSAFSSASPRPHAARGETLPLPRES